MDEFYEVWASDNTSCDLKFDCCLSPNLQRTGTGSTELEVFGVYRCLTCEANWRCYPTRPVADAWEKLKTYNSLMEAPPKMSDLCFNCRKPLTTMPLNVTGTGIVPGFDGDGKLISYSTCAATFCSQKCRDFHVPRTVQDNKATLFPLQETQRFEETFYNGTEMPEEEEE